MNKEEVLKIINDIFINPKISDYNRELIQAFKDKPYYRQMEKNIEIMNDLKKYLKENLK